ncbi:branched-chain amino acid ABC transporter substrate-binding protein [Dongia sp.]|uniref:branched-chain amino acid ABC transporter substrate-binding protein n=1 Tax=Dongia sp. TaxID=1977262 RepID=UPI0035AFB52F
MSAFLLSACAGPSGPTQEEIAAEKAKVVADAASARNAADADGQITIGLAAPLSGDLKDYGLEMRQGAEMAVADLNAAGGVLGRKLVLEEADDRCGIEDASRAATELVRKGVVFVDGHFCSGSTIRGSEVYGPADVLQITPSSTNDLVTDIAVQKKITTLLRVVGRDDRQGDFAADWIAANFAGERIGIVSDNSIYGKGIAARLIARLKAKGIAPVIQGEFVQGQTSYNGLINKMKDVKPRLLYVAAYHDDIGRLTWGMRVAQLETEVVGPDVLNNTEFWSFSEGRGSGVRFSDFAPAIERPEAADVVAKLQAAGIQPSNYSLNAYAAIQVFAAAAEATKGTDAAKLAEYLRQNSVKTVLGDLSWDQKGDLTAPNYIWYVWQDGLAVRQ